MIDYTWRMLRGKKWPKKSQFYHATKAAQGVLESSLRVSCFDDRFSPMFGLAEIFPLALICVSYKLRHAHARADDRDLSSWINSLRDRIGRARIQVRVDRLVHGNPGQHRGLGSGVYELKIDFGPGYRVYYTKREGEIIVLLAAGDKSTQQKDIETAISLAQNL